MGIKLLWTGLTMIQAVSALGHGDWVAAGALIMVIGCVLFLIDK